MIRHPLRTNDIRETNEKLVLNFIFQHRVASQSQVVQETGLKAPTVFRIFAKLEDAGYIRPCDSEKLEELIPEGERKGRRPNYFCVEPTCGYAVGVDFSSLAAAAIVVDFGNRVIYQDTTDFQTGQDRDSILNTIASMIQKALNGANIEPSDVMGIGIASPGVVDTVTGHVLEYGRIAGLSNYPLKDYFEKRFEVPVLVHNNASVIASSAYHYGAASDEDSLLAILVRSGVGGALITHGNVFLNGTATALELGRTSVFAATDTPGANEPEQLETILAEQPLLTLLQKSHPVETWTDAGEKLSVEQAETALAYPLGALTTTIRNLYHIFHPQAVLLISRFPLLAQLLGRTAERALPERKVIPMVYDPVQACYGSTDLVFKWFFAGGAAPARNGNGGPQSARE